MAVVDYFLKLDGIKGESTDNKHKEEIDIQSWSWGAIQSSAQQHGTAGKGAGKVSVHDISFVATMSKASPKLALHCCNGQHIKNAILTCRKAGKDQQEYLVIKMDECFVTSYQTSGGGGDNIIPSDSFSLSFTKINVDYKEQKAEGTLGGAVPFWWDVHKNTGG